MPRARLPTVTRTDRELTGRSSLGDPFERADSVVPRARTGRVGPVKPRSRLPHVRGGVGSKRTGGASDPTRQGSVHGGTCSRTLEWSGSKRWCVTAELGHANGESVPSRRGGKADRRGIRGVPRATRPRYRNLSMITYRRTFDERKVGSESTSKAQYNSKRWITRLVCR